MAGCIDENLVDDMRATDYQLIGGASKAVPAFSYPEESWTILSGKPLDHDEQTPAELRNRVGLLFRCVDIRADSMLTVPWRIYKGDNPVWEYTDDEPPEELEWLADLPEFIRFTEMMFCIKPQVYWYKVRNQHEVPKGLQWFARSTMTPLWDDRDGLTGFKRRINQHDEETYALDEIVYLWKMNPLHETEVDTSPVEAALAAAGVIYNVDQFIAGFFERGAIKATLLTVGGNPPKQERERIRNWWQRAMSGIGNAFASDVLSADAIKPIVVGEGLGELSNAELTGEKRQDLVSTLGVPHHKVFSNSANFATAQEDTRNFYVDTILPEFRLIQKIVNKQLLVPAGYRLRNFPKEMDIFQEDETGRAQSFGIYVDRGIKLSVAAEMLGLELPEGVKYIDLDDDEQEEEPEGTEDSTSEVDADAKEILGYHIEQGVVTRNEARASVGLAPVDDDTGERIRSLREKLELLTLARGAGVDLEGVAQEIGLGIDVKPTPSVPSSFVPNDDEPEDGDDDNGDSANDTELVAEQRRFRAWAKKRIDRASFDPAEFSTDLLTETDKAAIIAELQEDGDAEDSPFSFSNGTVIPDAKTSTAAFKQMLLQLDPEDDEEEQKIRFGVEDDATDEIESALEKQRRALLPSNTTPTDAASVTSRVDETSQPVRDAIRRSLIQAADLGVVVAVQQFENIGLGFDWTMANERARAYANLRAGQLITGINDTTRRQVQQAIAEWIANGDPLWMLVQELEPTFGRNRARLIASTEVTDVYARATLEGYREAGYAETEPEHLPPLHPRCRCWIALDIHDDGSANYVFLTSVDERVCPVCGPLHGQNVGVARSARQFA